VESFTVVRDALWVAEIFTIVPGAGGFSLPRVAAHNRPCPSVSRATTPGSWRKSDFLE
jgi:hypothetical protein